MEGQFDPYEIPTSINSHDSQKIKFDLTQYLVMKIILFDVNNDLVMVEWMIV